MFMQPLKTAITLALRNTFDEAHPAEEWLKYGKGDGTGRLNVSIEFPIEEQAYPGIWVDFEPTAQIRTAGIKHREYIQDEDTLEYSEVQRWRFQGMISYTVVAMSSAVRDRLFDELVNIAAFGQDDPIRGRFRAGIESNEFVACNIDWDEISLSGFTATPGTPWGTDDVIYEATIRMECLGEFVSQPGQDSLLPLNAIVHHPYNDQEPDPTTPGGWL
jgi:hypothetical protein